MQEDNASFKDYAICTIFGCEPSWETIRKVTQDWKDSSTGMVFSCIRCGRKKHWRQSKTLIEIAKGYKADQSQTIKDLEETIQELNEEIDRSLIRE